MLSFNIRPFSLADVYFTLLKALSMGAKQYTLKGENVKKFIRMVITVFKIVIWGGKSSVLWSTIAFYGYAGAPP